jgi:hypothetical protein
MSRSLVGSSITSTERPSKQPSEQETVALAARERPHWRQRPFVGKEKIPQVTVDVLRLVVDRHGVVAVSDRRL